MSMNVNIIQTGRVHNLLTDVIATGEGSSYLKPSTRVSFQASGTTSAGTGAVSILVQGSNDGTNWLTLGTISLTLGTVSTTDGFVNESTWKYLRGNVSSISGTNATVTLLMGV